MLDWLTPAERRGALLLIALLLTGAGWDMWQAGREARRPGAGDRLAARVDAPAPVTPAAGAGKIRSEPGASDEPRLDLNRAGPAELDALPGIGPVLAARILEQRRRNGPFRRIEDLLAVRGVGPRLLERLRPYLRAGGADLAVPPAPGAAMQSAASAGARLADSTSVAPRRSR